jgi:hypothetical protein
MLVKSFRRTFVMMSAYNSSVSLKRSYPPRRPAGMPEDALDDEVKNSVPDSMHKLTDDGGICSGSGTS